MENDNLWRIVKIFDSVKIETYQSHWVDYSCEGSQRKETAGGKNSSITVVFLCIIRANWHAI